MRELTRIATIAGAGLLASVVNACRFTPEPTRPY